MTAVVIHKPLKTHLDSEKSLPLESTCKLELTCAGKSHPSVDVLVLSRVGQGVKAYKSVF